MAGKRSPGKQVASAAVSDEPSSQSEIILYQTEGGRTHIQCRFENETIWLTQAQIAELFQTTPQNVTLHLKAALPFSLPVFR